MYIINKNKIMIFKQRKQKQVTNKKKKSYKNIANACNT